jgi:hypothetical protein
MKVTVTYGGSPYSGPNLTDIGIWILSARKRKADEARELIKRLFGEEFIQEITDHGDNREQSADS